jgi:hypothetical protein
VYEGFLSKKIKNTALKEKSLVKACKNWRKASELSMKIEREKDLKKIKEKLSKHCKK